LGRNSFLLWIVQGPKIFPFDSLLSLSSRWSNCSCCRSAPWPPQELAGEHRSQEQINNSHGFHPEKRRRSNINEPAGRYPKPTEAAGTLCSRRLDGPQASDSPPAGGQRQPEGSQGNAMVDSSMAMARGRSR